MPQGPLQTSNSVKPTSSAFTAFKGAPQQLDLVGALMVGKGVNSSLNLTAGAHLIKSSAGRIAKVIVNTAASTIGGVNDTPSTAGVLANNLIFAIPETIGVYDVDFPCLNGIVVTVGTGGVVSISFQ